ncbi:MAG: alpha/beta fold hydrolase [Candidatus Acidiferrum sp.]
MRWQLRTLFALGVSCLSPFALSVSAKDVASKTVFCGKYQYHYLLYSPQRSGTLPAILVLHGAGDQPDPMLEAWKSLAKKEGIALIAPALPRVAAFEAVAPQVFRCIVEEAKKSVLLDPRRIYIFGHSMGGYLAYDAAMLQSKYFAAAAIHAMGISEDYYWIVGRAERKIPVAIYVGDGERPDLYDKACRTRDLLRKEKFPVHYVELRDHDHNYYALSDRINEDAWDFLKDKKLPSPYP